MAYTFTKAQTTWTFRTVNSGDIIQPSQTLEEKSKQIAVDAVDLIGSRVVVPTYFMVDYPNGEKKALHHVRDAQAISDMIRQMRLYEEENSEVEANYSTLLSGLQLTLIVLMLLFTPFTGLVAISHF